MCDYGSDPSAVKDVSGTMGETCMGPEDSTAVTHEFPDFGGCLVVMQEDYGGEWPCLQEIHTEVFWVDGTLGITFKWLRGKKGFCIIQATFKMVRLFQSKN